MHAEYKFMLIVHAGAKPYIASLNLFFINQSIYRILKAIKELQYFYEKEPRTVLASEEGPPARSNAIQKRHLAEREIIFNIASFRAFSIFE